MHDVWETTVKYTVPYILQEIQNYNFQAVTVGTCLGDPEANWYRSP